MITYKYWYLDKLNIQVGKLNSLAKTEDWNEKWLTMFHKISKRKKKNIINSESSFRNSKISEDISALRLLPTYKYSKPSQLKQKHVFKEPKITEKISQALKMISGQEMLIPSLK